MVSVELLQGSHEKQTEEKLDSKVVAAYTSVTVIRGSGDGPACRVVSH